MVDKRFSTAMYSLLILGSMCHLALGKGKVHKEASADDYVPPEGDLSDAGDDGYAKGPKDSLDKLHGETNFADLAKHSWNMFRYCGDYLHLIGIFVLIATLAKNGACSGISRSTQILYTMVFVTRYLDLFDHAQTVYLVFFKCTYIATSCLVLVLFYQLDKTYERQKDTCSLTFIIGPCAAMAMLFTEEWTILETLWTFSEFVEGFAMVPQYVFCYRDKAGKDMGVLFYVMCLGGYRVFYALNWIYKKLQMPQYHDYTSWLGGIVEILFFLDFLNYRFTRNSFLRSMVLTVDTKINEISEKVELKVVGSSSRAVIHDEKTGELRKRGRTGGGEEESIVV